MGRATSPTTPRSTRPETLRGEELRGPELFTVGYAGRTPDELIALLGDAGVDRVVDVRELPLSRRPGFSKSRLAEALERAGIRYEHVRELGNPRPLRDLYRRGDVDAGARAYREHLDDAGHRALVELAESVAIARTCLLCVEESHRECHRAVIAEALAERLPLVAVVHL